MDSELFTKPSGRLVEVERDPPLPTYVAYVPDPLPPESEGGAIAAVARELGEASLALGQLTGIGEFFPNPDLLVGSYLRREAVASSRIEGTMASFSDIVSFEAGIRPPPGSDAKDVLNYITALNGGLRANPDEVFSLDFVRSLHRQLMTGARGEAFSNPGEFRFIQNHVGILNGIENATYVPPPPAEMHTALDQLLGYVNAAKPGTPPLVEVAWMHYQFEAVHPLPRRQRPRGPHPHPPSPSRAPQGQPSAALPQPLLRATTGRLLPALTRGQFDFGLGGVASLLPRRSGRAGARGHLHGTSGARTPRRLEGAAHGRWRHSRRLTALPSSSASTWR